MPSPRKRKPTRRADAYTQDHVCALAASHDYFRAFGDWRTPEGRETADEAMRRAWPILRARVFAYHRKRGRQGMPGGWWKYESPEPRNDFETEAAQLARMGIASAAGEGEQTDTTMKGSIV